MRSVLAVLTGYAIFAVSALLLFQLSGHDPHGAASPPFKTLTILIGTGAAIIGGYIAGTVAKRSPLSHATALSVVIAIIAAWSLYASPVKAAIWTQVAALLVMAPAAILGGIFRSLQRTAN